MFFRSGYSLGQFLLIVLHSHIQAFSYMRLFEFFIRSEIQYDQMPHVLKNIIDDGGSCHLKCELLFAEHLFLLIEFAEVD